MSVLRRLFHDLDSAARGHNEVTLAGVGAKLPVDAGLFENMKAFLSMGIRIDEVEKLEPEPRPLPRQSPRSSASSPSAHRGDITMGEDLGVGPPGSDDESVGAPSVSASVGVFVESHSAEFERRSEMFEFEEPDCQCVVLSGRIGADGPRVVAQAWYEPSGIKLMAIFDRFDDTVEEFLDGLYQQPFVIGLDSFELRDQRIIFSTAKTRFYTQYARVRIRPGINVVFDAKPSPGLARLIDCESPEKRLSFFGVLPDDLAKDEITLFSAPLFEIRSESLTLTRGFVRMSGGLRTIGGEVLDDDGGFRVLNVSLRGTCTIGDEQRSLYAPVVADHELLQLRFAVGADFVAKQSAFDGLMGGNSAWRDALDAHIRLGDPEVALRSYHRTIDLATGRVVSVDSLVEVPPGTLNLRGAISRFTTLYFKSIVGFPHEGADAQIHVSGSGTAHVASLTVPVMLKNASVTLELVPSCEQTVTAVVSADSVAAIGEAFGAAVSLHEVDLMAESKVCCNLRFRAADGPVLDVWPLEIDA